MSSALKDGPSGACLPTHDTARYWYDLEAHITRSRVIHIHYMIRHVHCGPAAASGCPLVNNIYALDAVIRRHCHTLFMKNRGGQDASD